MKKQYVGYVSPQVMSMSFQNPQAYVGLWFGNVDIINSSLNELFSTEWITRGGQYPITQLMLQWHINRITSATSSNSFQSPPVLGDSHYSYYGGYNSLYAPNINSNLTLLHQGDFREFQMLGMLSNKYNIEISNIRIAMNSGTILSSDIFIMFTSYDFENDGNFIKKTRNVSQLINIAEANNTAVTFGINSIVGENSAMCIGIPQKTPNTSGLNITININ